MANQRLVWDEAGKKTYQTGVDRVVLYPYADNAPGTGVAWSGVSSIANSPEGAEATAIYADNRKYLVMRSAEDHKGTITAYQSPEEFDECDGCKAPTGTVGLTFGQQTRKMFGLAYRTKVGNDQEFDDFGYKIHLVYGCTASPSEKEYQSINDSPEAAELSWEYESVPVEIEGYKPLAHIEIDSTKLTTEQEKACLTKLENILYGSDSAAARLPMPAEVITIMTPDAG